MSVVEIEKAISALPVSDVDKLANWLNDYREQLWDRQLEEDVRAGRLDSLIDQAKQQIRAGSVKSL